MHKEHVSIQKHVLFAQLADKCNHQSKQISEGVNPMKNNTIYKKQRETNNDPRNTSGAQIHDRNITNYQG